MLLLAVFLQGTHGKAICRASSAHAAKLQKVHRTCSNLHHFVRYSGIIAVSSRCTFSTLLFIAHSLSASLHFDNIFIFIAVFLALFALSYFILYCILFSVFDLFQLALIRHRSVHICCCCFVVFICFLYFCIH